MTEPELPINASVVEPEAYLKAIFDSAEDVIISKTLTGRIETWNPAAERLFGYTVDEMLGQPITVLFPPDRLHEEEVIMARICRGERVEHFETIRKCKGGRLVNLSVTISPIFDAQGVVVGASKIARDITARLRDQKVMWLQANFDSLTGMPYRRLFEEELGQRLLGGPTVFGGVLVINVDRLKEFNAALGRQVGNQVIAQVAGRIRDGIRRNDLVARFLGAEFGVALVCQQSMEEIEQVVDRLLHAIKQPIQLGAERVFVSASIGIAKFPEDDADSHALVEEAELALHEAKRGGRGRSHCYSHEIEAQAQQGLKLASDLRLALQRNELFLVYQPIVDLRTGLIRKCEALLRWRHPEQGLIAPPVFIAIAEQIGLIHEIGDWVFSRALRQVHAWRDAIDPDFQVSINMSPVQLMPTTRPLLDWADELRHMQLPPQAVVIEITETVMVAPELERSARLAAILQAGFSVAIDDFGTGYSSLAQLSRIEAGFLKIDQSFVRKLHAGSKDQILCKAIVAMASALGHLVVAEGIETQEQLDLLKEMGCDFGQGYLFAKPISPVDLQNLAVSGPVC